MVVFLSIMVGNMRERFCFKDPADPPMSLVGGPDDWEMGDGQPEQQFLEEFPHRATLALTLAVLLFAQSAIQDDNDYYCNDVFLGYQGSYLGGGSGFGQTVVEMLLVMIPFREQDFIQFARQMYPKTEILDLLGPVLVQKVVLSSAFFRWVPPSDEGNDDGLFDTLETPLEEMDTTEEWMAPWMA